MENCKNKVTIIPYYYWIIENSIKDLNSVNLDFTGRFLLDKSGKKHYEVRGVKIYF